MENWTRYLMLASETEGFKLNTDILETNVINIILLIGILIFTAGKFLQELLITRQEKILNNIQDSEKRLLEAQQRVAEAKSQWAQAKIIIEEIKKETKQTKQTLLESEIAQANTDLSQRFNNILMVLKYREKQVFNDIMKQVSKLALNQVVTKLQKHLGNTELSLINDSKINELGGQL